MIFKKTNSKRKKLANLLLKNYVISFILMVFVILFSTSVATIVALIYFDVLPSNIHDSTFIMNENYEKIDTKDIESLGGFALVLDKDYNILYTKGKTFPKLEGKLSIQNFVDLINSSYPLSSQKSLINIEATKSDYVYSSSYNQKKDFLLIVGIPRDRYKDFTTRRTRITVKQFVFISIIICVLILTIIFIIYSRITSRYFVKPLKALIKGANKLAHGNFSARIRLQSNNEFAELSDAFNIMASKIDEERRLKEKSENQRKKLILDISHDLKNPLASIMGYANYLTKNNSIPHEEIQKYLSIIESNSIRANMLIQDLFEFSKLESSSFELSLKRVDICEFLRELIASYIQELEDKGFTYDFQIPETSIDVMIDKNQLDRSFSNLILNCVKYNPQGTKLSINLYDEEDFVKIVLKDTGIGIENSKIESIFNPFVRVDESRNSKSGGTGLGLAITKTIIEKHKGFITLSSDLGTGCEFHISLPKYKNEYKNILTE